MKSLRSKITVLSTIVLVIVLALAAVLIVTLVGRQLRSELVEQNNETLSQLAARIEAGEDPWLINLPVATDGTEFTITQDGEYVNSSILSIEFNPDFDSDFDADSGFIASETVIVAADVFNDEELDALFEDVGTWEPTTITADDPDGVTYEVSSLSLLSVVDRSVDQVRSVLWIVIPILAVIFGALVWYTTGRALRPVDEIRAKAASISVETLHERVDEPGTDDEIDRLAGTLNSMLDRLDRGARLQKEFVSDASHELQTPLTVMLGEARLAATSGDPTRLAEANTIVIEHGQYMTNLIQDLLNLARTGEAGLHRSEVDLDDVLREQARLQIRPIDTSSVAPVRMMGDVGSLGRLFRNLIDNAAQYANETVMVSSFLDDATGSAVIWVDDDGPGIPADQRTRVFDRFARLDASRNRTTGGTGLGLAIAKAIVDAHLGTITLTDSHLGGTRAEVRLPLPL